MSTADGESSYVYTIQNMKAFKDAKNTAEFKSPFFELHGFKWCLRIFPNGSTSHKNGNVNCFLWLRSLPPKFSKVAVNITLYLQELDVKASFPHQFTDKAVTRGWTTGTVKTVDLQDLDSITFAVDIALHDIYGAAGNLVSHLDDSAEETADAGKPIMNRQSSELMFDKQSMQESRLETLSLRLEELMLKFDSMHNAIDVLSERQEEGDANFSSIASELQGMRKFLGDEYKGSQCVATEENKAVKQFLTQQCNLGQYFALFVDNGVDNMDICKLLTGEDLRRMGIQKVGHQVLIASKIQSLSYANNGVQDLD